MTALAYPARFYSLVKFEHTIFALPFAYVGAFLAVDAVPSTHDLVWITVAMVGARSLAMGLNRLIDAKLDARNPRTASRELPAGLLTPVQVLLFCLYTLGVSIFKPKWVPGIPRESLTMHGWPLVKRCLWGIVPSLVLIFLVLGTIFLGLATPTEGGAMGMVGAIVLAVLHRPEFSRHAKVAAWIGAAALAIVTVPATVVWQSDWMPAGLLSTATTALDRIRAPIFVVCYIALAVVMWEAVRITALRDLIRRKEKGEKLVTAEPVEEDNVIDLMEALKKSLKTKGRTVAAKAPGPKRRIKR